MEDVSVVCESAILLMRCFPCKNGNVVEGGKVCVCAMPATDFDLEVDAPLWLEVTCFEKLAAFLPFVSFGNPSKLSLFHFHSLNNGIVLDPGPDSRNRQGMPCPIQETTKTWKTNQEE